MKRFIFSLFTAGLVITSCSVNELPDNQPVDKAPESIFASTGPEARTSVGAGENGAHKVNWSEGDQIMVMGSDNVGRIYVSQEGGKPTAEFLPAEDAEALDFTKGVIAGYPAKDMYISSTDPSDPIYLTIPDTQPYVEGSFGDNVMPMISEVSYENVLKFSNAAGVLKLMVSSVTGDVDIRKITIKATDGKPVGGECGYTPETKTYFFDGTMISSNTVTIDCGEGVSVGSEAKAFHVVVPHQEYTGLEISVLTSDGLQQVFPMKEGRTLDVKRSHILSIPIKIDNLSDPTKPSVEMSLKSVSFTDFNFSINIRNASSYYCGIQTKSSFDNEMKSGSFIENLPYYGAPYTSQFSYSGSILKFKEDIAENIFLEPGQTYVLWIVVHNSDNKYTMEDVHALEITMKSFTPGGTVEVKTSGHEITTEMIGMDIVATGAKFIYCQLLPDEALEGYASDHEIIEALIRPEGIGTRIDNSKDYFERRQLKPGTEMTFIATAIDKDGCYGPLLKEEYQTESIEFNTLVIEIDKDIEKLKENGGVLSWSVSGGEAASYKYFYRKTDNNYWTSTFGSDYSLVEAKMVLDPGLWYFKNTTETSAKLDNPALAEGQEYVFVILAVAEDGSSSRADHWIFTY